MPPTTFTNARICHAGQLSEPSTFVVGEDGYILDNNDTKISSSHVVDLKGAVVAPGLIELQTNGMRGFHFTHFDDADSYAAKIDEVARYLVSRGVTGFYATVPTVASEEFKKVSLGRQS